MSSFSFSANFNSSVRIQTLTRVPFALKLTYVQAGVLRQIQGP